MVELTPEQAAELRRLNQEMANAQDLLNRAEAATLPVADLQAHLVRIEALRKGLLAQFAPGISTKRKR